MTLRHERPSRERASWREPPGMAVILALDQGTTSSRAIVFSDAGIPLAIDQREFAQHFPRPGWVEHDANELWSTQLAVARGALQKAGVRAQDVAAIGVTNQRETTVLWDRASGAPVAKAIVWQDRRTADVCEMLRERGHAGTVEAKTGLVLDPYFSATKIAWLLDENPDLRERAERGEIAFGTVDSWLIWNLTGGARHVTDVTNASRTMLFDIHTLAWSDELLALFRVPRAMLPGVLPSTADFGSAAPAHFGAAIAIGGVAGDQQAALIGQSGFRRGIAKNTYGTGSFVVLNTGSDVVRSRNGLIATVAYAFAPGEATYALEGSIFSTGSAVQWLRDGLHMIEKSADVERLAGEVADNGGVYFVPAFSGLGAPYWDANARALMIGMTRGTTRAHIARAVIEAMAYQTADVVEAMQHDAGFDLTELRVDGGATANATAMQFQADVLGVPVVRAQTQETTALGAAYLAGLQSGVWPDIDALETHRRIDRTFQSQSTAQWRHGTLARWRRAVERSRDWSTP